MKKEVFKLVRDGFAATHWIKGAYRRPVKEHYDEKTDRCVVDKYGFCAMGGFSHVLSLPYDHPYVEQYAIALAKKLPRRWLEQHMRSYGGLGPEEALTDEWLAIAFGWRNAGFWHGVITSFNDDPSVTLEQMLQIFDAVQEDEWPKDERDEKYATELRSLDEARS